MSLKVARNTPLSVAELAKVAMDVGQVKVTLSGCSVFEFSHNDSGFVEFVAAINTWQFINKRNLQQLFYPHIVEHKKPKAILSDLLLRQQLAVNEIYL